MLVLTPLTSGIFLGNDKKLGLHWVLNLTVRDRSRANSRENMPTCGDPVFSTPIVR
ncbi:hypothetical protein PISMIDRAFT_680839 [Pisolithus microcarpus 441]|uniref:Uncharacterized protein n=1 Tax=Pisolithus microcarpus 441 TaxID=765257 RepID=A0A0C9YZ92_9AGAM|nr:hypothetical protein PISMIDRAFT_680839 [Pisolithus microcarpus 441]